MVSKLLGTVAAALVVAGFAPADEVDDGTRLATELAKSPEKFYYGKVWLDSKGKIVIQVNREGRVTKDTKVAMGIFDEKKKWMPGEAIEGGIGADLFKDKGKVLRVRVTVEADGATITRIFVTNTDERLERASGEFDAIYKRHGAFTNGSGPVSYVRVELDDKGRVINSFPLTTSLVTKDTMVAMGKYNDKVNKWETGADIPGGVYGDIFKDPTRIGRKNDARINLY